MGQGTSSTTVLIVEDEREIRNLIQMYLDKEGYRTRVAATGPAALDLVKVEPPDVIILDLMLPDMDGLEVCKTLRAHPDTAQAAILILTAKTDEADTVLGLELGADDYMTKPFSPRALVARIKALLRRLDHTAEEEARPLIYGALTLDLLRHEATVGGRPVALTSREFALLEYLLRHLGRVLSREVLLSSVWGYSYGGTTRTIDVHIHRLRKKIPLLAQVLLTLRQVGYKLRDPSEEMSSRPSTSPVPTLTGLRRPHSRHRTLRP